LSKGIDKERLARDLGLDAADCVTLNPDAKPSAIKAMEDIIAKAMAGAVECPLCKGEATFRRDGGIYVVHCQCGFGACGCIPETRH